MAGRVDSVEILSRLMGASLARARAVASNVANANTPGYRRQVVRFEADLAGAIARGERDLARIQPKLELDPTAKPRPDGNDVSLETELATDRANRLAYETYAAMLQGHFDLLRAAIDSGR